MNERDRRRLVLACVLVTIGVSACATKKFNALMTAWHGHQVADLFGTWGPPTYVYSDGRGGRVIVYLPESSPDAANSGPLKSPNMHPTNPERMAPRGEFRLSMTAYWPIYRIFFVDPTGQITNSEWRGDWVCCSQ
jgi:hypothetical protein